jgi:CBS domain-containing protein
MKTTVSEVMEGAVIVVRAEDTVGEARDRMHSLDIGAVPVIDSDGNLTGILTADDLVSDYPLTLPVSRVMQRQVLTLGPDDDVRRAAAEMRAGKRHHIVVLRGTQVIGILSSWDLLRLVEAPEGDS